MTTHKEALEAAYLAGFNASGEGYNGEYPFGDKMQDPAENRVWKKDRDNYIKEALAQPEQEPVAHCEAGPEYCWKCNEEIKPTYGSEEIRKLREVNKHLADHIVDATKMVAQPEQEPVAWELGAEVYWGDSPELSDYVRKEGTPLYTTPPQRKPLTWEQQMRIHNECGDSVSLAIALTEAAHGIKE